MKSRKAWQPGSRWTPGDWARPGIHGRWDWRAREHATGLIHGLSSAVDDAVTWCGQHIVVRWDNWTEMPATSVVTCVRCVIKL